jgi:hypothetical protein
MVPPGPAERSLVGCCFTGLLRGTPTVDVDEGMMEVMANERKW